jgi:hypothetical protein
MKDIRDANREEGDLTGNHYGAVFIKRREFRRLPCGCVLEGNGRLGGNCGAEQEAENASLGYRGF